MSKPKQNPDPTARNSDPNADKNPQNQTGEDQGNVKSAKVTDRHMRSADTSRGVDPYTRSAGGHRW